MGVRIPGQSMFWRPSEEKKQEKWWGIGQEQMKGFDLPSQFKWNAGQMMDPYYARATGDIGGAYGQSIQDFMSSPAAQNLMASSGLNQQSMRQALGAQRGGIGATNEELARINALIRGGWDISRPETLAQIAPEVNAAAAGLNKSIEAARQSGMGGGVLDVMKYMGARQAGTDVGNAYQNAIRQAYQTKQGLANALLGVRNMEMSDPTAQALSSILGSMYGQRAGALGGLAGQYFTGGMQGEQSNLQMLQDLFKFLQSQSTGIAGAQQQRETSEANQAMQTGGQIASSYFSDVRLKTPPGEVRGVLSEIRKLPVYDYRYNDKAEEVAGIPTGTPGRGVMAQDLEKIPSMRHLVHKDPLGYRSVDVYGLTATALRAVQELDTKLNKLAYMRAPKTLSRMRFKER